MFYSVVILFFCGLLSAVKTQGIDPNDTFSPNDTSGMFNDLPNVTYRVVTLPLDPWVMMTNDGGYDGFLVEILDHLSFTMNFNYEIYIVRDNKYGTSDSSDGTWNGMIGELAKDEADIAAGALIETEKRRTAVDFTNSIMHTGQRILIKKPTLERHTVLTLFRPMSVEVWVMVLVIYVVTTLFLFIVNKFSPSEWSSVSKADDKLGARDSFELKNCFFYVHSTLTLQGYKEAPRSPAGRIVTCCWFSCVFLLLAAYIANLSAMFVARQPDKPVVPFKTFQEMVSQTSYSYGIVADGKVFSAMQDSSDPLIKNILSYTNTFLTDVRNTEDAVKKVRNGDFAAIIDSLQASYIVRKNCDLMMVGELILRERIGFACQKGSGICNQLSDGILQLRESGELHMMEKRWWRDGGSCPDTHLVNYVSRQETVKMNTAPLMIADLSIAFLVLLIGYFLGAVLLILEILCAKFCKKRGDSEEPVQMTGVNGNRRPPEVVTVDEDADVKAPIAAAEP